MTTRSKVNILGFLTVLFWAAAFPVSKIALSYYNPNSMAVLRCGIGAIFLLILGRIKKISPPKKQDIPKFFLSGLMGFSLYLIFFNAGIQTLNSATSSILIATTPIMTAIASIFVYNEKIGKLGWFAIALEFAGILILSLWNAELSINSGIFWTLAGALVFCGYNLYQKKLSHIGYSSYEIVTYSLLCGFLLLIFFLPKGISEIALAPPKQILMIFLLGIFPSGIAYTLWGKAIMIADKTSDATNFMFVTPLLSALIGFILLREIPSMGTLLGGLFVLLGLIVFQLDGKAKKA